MFTIRLTATLYESMTLEILIVLAVPFVFDQFVTNYGRSLRLNRLAFFQQAAKNEVLITLQLRVLTITK